jgi:site-specific recombinase XerD
MSDLTVVYDQFLSSYQKERNPSVNTLQAMKSNIPRFLTFCGGNGRTTIQQVAKEDVIAYLNSLNGLRTSSKMLHLRHISIFLNWLYDKLHLLKGRPEKVTYQGPPDIPRASKNYLTDYEIAKMAKGVGKLSVKDQCLLHLLLSGAVAIGKLVTLEIRDIDFETGTITLRGRKTRMVRIPPAAHDGLKLLVEGRDPSEMLFALEYRALVNHTNLIYKKLGIRRSGRSSYAFRHTAIRDTLKRLRADLVQASELTGNSPQTICNKLTVRKEED